MVSICHTGCLLQVFVAWPILTFLTSSSVVSPPRAQTDSSCHRAEPSHTCDSKRKAVNGPLVLSPLQDLILKWVASLLRNFMLVILVVPMLLVWKVCTIDTTLATVSASSITARTRGFTVAEGEEGTKEKKTRQEQREERRVKREKIHFQCGGAWPFLVDGVLCLVHPVNARFLSLLNSVDYDSSLISFRSTVL